MDWSFRIDRTKRRNRCKWTTNHCCFDEATQEWVINGSKIFITNAGYAHVYVIFAMTDKSKGVKGISAFIIEAGTPGFSIGKKERN